MCQLFPRRPKAPIPVFLGIELDSLSMTVSLPREKQDRLFAMIQDWGAKNPYTKRELLSLIGYLQHACHVIRQGRASSGA